jgi:hypothetical protein
VATTQLRKLCLELVKGLHTKFQENDATDRNDTIASMAFTPASMHAAAVKLVKCIAPTGDLLVQMVCLR